MLAVVKVDAGQDAERGKATDEEGQRTPPPPPQPLAVKRPPRQPTPDHPPYCWMIGEAIDELAEDGGSSEDAISAFICARHPGVPPAHGRLLPHYLGKHVSEGVFVRTAAGRYERCSEENAAEELPVEKAEPGSYKPASVEAKRGRGRPRRDGSPPSAGRKDGSAWPQWMTQPAGSSLTLAAAAKDSVRMPLVAVADKDGSQAPSLKPKRRRHRLRKLGMGTTMDSSGEALVAGKKHGSDSKVPYALDKEHEPSRDLGLVIFSSATSAMDKACTEVPPTTPPPVDGGQPLSLTLVTTTEVPVTEPAPTPAMGKDGGDASSIVDKNDSICTTPTSPEPGSQACEPALMAAEVPPTKPLVYGGQPLGLALVTTTEAPVPVPEPAPTPAMDKDGGQPLDLALVTTTEVPVSEPAPTPAMGKDGGDASSIVGKNENICTTPTVPEPGSQACKLALMAPAAAGFVPVLVAKKKGSLKETPSATYKDVLQPRKASSAPTAGKKAGGKALSVSALLEGRRRQHKSATVATADRSALTPDKKLGCKLSFASPKLAPVIAGGCPTPASVTDQGSMEASAALKQHGRKLCPVTADEISDDPGIVLLALPSQTPAASNA